MTNDTECPNLDAVMGTANLKISSREVKELKHVTGEKTGRKAVRKALIYFLKEARQRRITKVLRTISFRKGFDPLKLRHRER